MDLEHVQRVPYRNVRLLNTGALPPSTPVCFRIPPSSRKRGTHSTIKKVPVRIGRVLVDQYTIPEDNGVMTNTETYTIDNMKKEVRVMASGTCPHCRCPIKKKEYPTLTQYYCVRCGIRASSIVDQVTIPEDNGLIQTKE